jgi:hypothetical protein
MERLIKNLYYQNLSKHLDGLNYNLPVFISVSEYKSDYTMSRPLLIDCVRMIHRNWNSIIDKEVELLVVLYPICKIGIPEDTWLLILRDLKKVYVRTELWSTLNEIATLNWIVMREQESGDDPEDVETFGTSIYDSSLEWQQRWNQLLEGHTKSFSIHVMKLMTSTILKSLNKA